MGSHHRLRSVEVESWSLCSEDPVLVICRVDGVLCVLHTAGTPLFCATMSRS